MAAVVAAASAYQSYRLSRKIYDEIKSDEVIIFGPLHRPQGDPRYMKSVLQCTLFNKSHRKAYVGLVEAFDEKGEKIPITWSDSMNHLGNMENPTGLIGFQDSLNLVMRRNDAKEFDIATIHIKHSFSPDIVELSYRAYSDFI